MSLSQILAPFADPGALALVGGGTFAILALRTPFTDLVRTFAALRVLGRRPHDAQPCLDQIAALGRIAQRHGVVALDRSRIADPDVSDAVAAIVDGAGPDVVAERLTHARDARVERHLAVVESWAAAAEIAPAMGMIGTLIGLVRMFVGMTDPSRIGGAMALALLTTLYGAVLASVVAMPIAARLRRLARIEALERARLEAPLVALARRERPRLHEMAA